MVDVGDLGGLGGKAHPEAAIGGLAAQIAGASQAAEHSASAQTAATAQGAVARVAIVLRHGQPLDDLVEIEGADRACFDIEAGHHPVGCPGEAFEDDAAGFAAGAGGIEETGCAAPADGRWFRLARFVGGSVGLALGGDPGALALGQLPGHAAHQRAALRRGQAA